MEKLKFELSPNLNLKSLKVTNHAAILVHIWFCTIFSLSKHCERIAWMGERIRYVWMHDIFFTIISPSCLCWHKKWNIWLVYMRWWTGYWAGWQIIWLFIYIWMQFEMQIYSIAHSFRYNLYNIQFIHGICKKWNETLFKSID